LTLTGVTSAQRRARWDWYIGDAEARGRGAGRAAQAIGLELAFGPYGLQRVWSEVQAANEVALRAQAAAGFRREGYLRRHAYKHGEFRDVALLAILEAEWRARRESVLADLRASGLIAAISGVKVA
jgi:RimJ/RimL family protein N-acetyltransferase